MRANRHCFTIQLVTSCDSARPLQSLCIVPFSLRSLTSTPGLFFLVCHNRCTVATSYNLYHFVLLCTTLYYFVLLCTTLYYFVLLCTTLYYFVLLCTTLYYFVLLCTTLLCTTLYYFVLLCTTLYYFTLYYFVLLCTTLYYFVLLCTTLYNFIPLHTTSYLFQARVLVKRALKTDSVSAITFKLQQPSLFFNHSPITIRSFVLTTFQHTTLHYVLVSAYLCVLGQIF